MLVVWKAIICVQGIIFMLGTSLHSDRHLNLQDVIMLRNIQSPWRKQLQESEEMHPAAHP
jgi:hypothetical protein